jgi:hypothetical protein
MTAPTHVAIIFSVCPAGMLEAGHAGQTFKIGR